MKAASLLLALALASAACADDKPASLWVASMKEGQVGTLTDKKGKPASLVVKAVIDRDVILVANRADASKRFALELTMHGLAEGAAIDAKGLYKVTGTTKQRGSTYFYVEPAKAM
jgi:hypothetical protein